jgi:hypothetical protein
MQILRRTLRKFPRQQEQHNRQHSSSKPEPLEIAVNAAFGENALRTDDAPYDGVAEEDTAVGAGVFVFLIFVTDIFNVAEGPEKLHHQQLAFAPHLMPC